MCQVAVVHQLLVLSAHAARHARHVVVALRPARSRRVREALDAHAARLAHGVVGIVARPSLVVALSAQRAIGAREVGRGVGAARPLLVLLSGLAPAARSADSVCRFRARRKLKLAIVARALNA